MVFDIWEETRFHHRDFGEEFIAASPASPVSITAGSFGSSAVEAFVSSDWQGDALRALRGGTMLDRGDLNWNDPQNWTGRVPVYAHHLVEAMGGDRFVFIESPSDTGAAGKSGGIMITSAEEEIVVTGKRNTSGGFDWYVNGVSGSGEPPPIPDGEVSIQPDTPPMPLDEDVVEITIKINRPLTDSEKTALENLKTTIAAIETAIRNLADNATLKLANGATVTGGELKELWAKIDFIINDNNVAYGNNSYRGEANMTADGGLISFNIGGDGLDNYDNRIGGVNYLVAHELGHLTQWGTSFVYDQVTANDISRALLNGAELPYLQTSDPNFYTLNAPMEFSVPPTS